MNLEDKLWYILAYGKDIPEKDLPKYAKDQANRLIDEFKGWIDGHQIMLEKDKWFLDVKEIKKGLK